MVSLLRRRIGNRRGKVKAGCVLTLALLGVGVYLTIANIRTYIDYWAMKDEMRVQAQFANNLDDQSIRRRLRAKADELQLPPEARRITIRRRTRPREIVISTQWQVTLKLLVTGVPLTFSPEVRQQL
jgi:hypothetical protein